MSEGQGVTEPPEDVEPAGSGGARRSGGDPAAVLLAVERLGADVTALSRALAAQPEELAARLDVDAATAALGVRLGALGSALDQLRLSLLAALDRAAERVDAPAWLPSLESALAQLAPPAEGPPWLPGLHEALADVGSRFDAPAWLPDLRRALSALPEPVLEALAALSIGPRLDEVSGTVRRLADDPRLDEVSVAVRGLADDRRLEAVAVAVGRLVDDRRLDAVVATVLRMADDHRLDDVAATVQRLADDDRLDQLTAAVARLPDQQRLDELRAAVAADGLGDRLAKVEQALAELADGVRAGAAVGDALDHLGQRLASIEDAAGRVAEDARLLLQNVAPVPDRLSAIASQVDRITPLARAGDQAGTLFDRLDYVGGALVEVLAQLRAREVESVDDVDERFEGVVDVLAGVTRRQDEVNAAIASVLEQGRGPRDAEPEAATSSVAMSKALETVLDRMARSEQAVASHLDWVGERLTEVAAHLVPDEAGAAAASRDDERFEAVVARLATVARRQEELASAFSEGGAEDRSPMALTAVFDRMEQRERSIAARLDRIDAELRRLGSGAASDPPVVAEPGAEPDAQAGAGSLAESVGAIASITEDLARLIESTADRLDRRLARVESSLDAATERPPPAVATRPSVSPAAAALRLAELRAERALVQARLQEERLFAARSSDDEP